MIILEAGIELLEISATQHLVKHFLMIILWMVDSFKYEIGLVI